MPNGPGATGKQTIIEGENIKALLIYLLKINLAYVS